MGFTCFMVEVVGVQVRTALQYCYDVCSLYRKLQGLQSTPVMRDLQDLGRRLSLMYPTSARIRKPLLQQDFVRLDSVMNPRNMEHVRLKAMLLICFQTVSRFSDIIRCDVSDLQNCTHHMVLAIRMHKTKAYTGDRFTKKILAHPESPTTPLACSLSASLALRDYLRLHPPPARLAPTPLFRSTGGRRWTYNDALLSFRRLLRAASMDPMSYGLHSPRIGGATCALLDADGNELLVRTMGFWLGESVRRYCRPSKQRILAIQRRMIASATTLISGE